MVTGGNTDGVLGGTTSAALIAERNIEVFRSYHASALKHAADLDVGALIDERQLPYSKAEILAALCAYLALEERGQDYESVVALANDLASFQPGVGAVPIIPREEGLRRLLAEPSTSGEFAKAYDSMEAQAVRHASFQESIVADLRQIALACARINRNERHAIDI